MINKEKVVREGLSTCIQNIDQNCPLECPYYDQCMKYEGRVVFQPLLRDIMKLLEEQEPVAPGLEQDVDGVYSTCGNCKTRLWKILGVGFEINPDAMPKFCPQCGRAVKWRENHVE